MRSWGGRTSQRTPSQPSSVLTFPHFLFICAYGLMHQSELELRLGTFPLCSCGVPDASQVASTPSALCLFLSSPPHALGLLAMQLGLLLSSVQPATSMIFRNANPSLGWLLPAFHIKQRLCSLHHLLQPHLLLLPRECQPRPRACGTRGAYPVIYRHSWKPSLAQVQPPL